MPGSKSNRLRVFLLYWLPVVIYAGFIFFLSSFSYEFKAADTPYFDKFIHLGEYFIFGVLLFRAFTRAGLQHKKSFPEIKAVRYYLLVALISCLYGICDEGHQLFVPGREVSVYDIFADTIGGALGALIYKSKLAAFI